MCSFTAAGATNCLIAANEQVGTRLIFLFTSEVPCLAALMMALLGLSRKVLIMARFGGYAAKIYKPLLTI